MGLVLSVFGGRLVQLQVVDDAAYASAAEDQRVRAVTLPATRGDITTRDGATLATTVERKTIYADPELLQRTEDPRAAAERLAPLLEMPADRLEKQLRTPNDRYVVLKRAVSPEKAAEIVGLDLAGIATEPEQQRVYPADSLAGNILGFVGADGRGAAGLEYGRNGLLAGEDGKKVVEIGRQGQQIPAAGGYRNAPQPGRSVRLTIDREIQWKAQQSLARQVRRTEAASGSAVVMDPATGRILALAAAPTADPNSPSDGPDGTPGNPPLQHVFEPGSTAKVVTMAAALEGKFTPRTPVTVPPVLRVHGETIRDAYSHGTERMTLAGVLAKSSNIGTAKVGQRVGPQRLYRTMREFGLGRPTGIEFPASTSGIVPPPGKWDGVSRYTIPFGQGIAVNAVQMASVYATIANGGVRVEPSLVAGMTGADGGFRSAPEPGERRVVSSQTARQLGGMLETAASDRGTGSKAQIGGYRIAGKTGTAQRVDPACGCYRGYNATFTGFAPAEDPELVVQVAVHDPESGHAGGDVAAPVFRDIMSFAVKSLRIPPTDTKAATLLLRPD